MVISISSQKGGVGKTTTSISLSAGLARKDKRVLLVDVDSQANSSKVLIPNYISLRAEETVVNTIINRKPLPIHKTAISTLDIVPSHILLSNTDVELTIAKDHREGRLKNQLDKIKASYDYVFVDTPPALGWLTLNAFTAADRIIVVVEPGYFELDSIVQITRTISEAKDLYNPGLELWGLLFTKSEPTVNSRQSLQLLRQTYGENVFKTVIPRNTDMKDAHFNKQDIFGFAPQSSSAQAYDKLIRELFYEEKT